MTLPPDFRPRQLAYFRDELEQALQHHRHNVRAARLNRVATPGPIGVRRRYAAEALAEAAADRRQASSALRSLTWLQSEAGAR